ncbi:hypothetical protein EX30DRAFT_311175 [Ascodesmis nigricans]|uniref:Uncharacterized protein n=1 Tax=Ascodesmis nigricans TaxID=341454 RepID=A0A4S2MQE9_9PEZI|nr:hypothetical protein EX30DRAFT_311175 [Ascodesmis nigricans]
MQTHLAYLLVVAATIGSSTAVTNLVAAGADVNAQRGLDGGALQAAASNGHEEVVRLLVKLGADPDA